MYSRARRRHRLRQIDADLAAGAAARPASRHRVHRLRRCPRHPARRPAARDRIRPGLDVAPPNLGLDVVREENRRAGQALRQVDDRRKEVAHNRVEALG